MTARELRLRERIDLLTDERDVALAERDGARKDLAEFQEEVRQWPLAQLAARQFALVWSAG